MSSKQSRATKWDVEQIARIENEIAALQERYEQVQEAMKLNNPTYAELTAPKAISLSEVRKALGKHKAALLEYAVGCDKSYLFLVTVDDVKVVSLPGEGELGLRVSNLLQKVRDPKAMSYPEGYELFALLIKPVEDYIKDVELFIVPDGPLHYLPFELLLTEPVVHTAPKGYSGENESNSAFDFESLPYLLKRLTITYSASATVLFRSSKKQGSTKEYECEFVGIAPVNFDFLDSGDPWFRLGTAHAKLPPLKHTEDEIVDICRLFPAQKGKVFLRKQATKGVLRDGPATDCRFLHIATHGILNESRPFLSGLLMTPDSEGESGFLPANEVLQIGLRCQIAVLSACETGLGKLIKGEGPIGLTRAFWFAGAEKLVVSLWRVDDFATAELMKHFYTSLTGTVGVSEAYALRSAKLHMIQMSGLDSKRNHFAKPYYWAPFVSM